MRQLDNNWSERSDSLKWAVLDSTTRTAGSIKKTVYNVDRKRIAVGYVILVALARNNARNSSAAATLAMDTHPSVGGCPCVVEGLALYH
jgi:hypothetical protein